jgi:serine protease
MSSHFLRRALVTAAAASTVIVSAGRPIGTRDVSATSLDSKRALLGGLQSVALVADRLQSRQRGSRYSSSTIPRGRQGFVPGKLVVKFVEGLTDRDVSRAVSAVGGLDGRNLPYADFAVVTLADGIDPVEAAARAAAEPGVVYAEPLARRYPTYRPNDPLYEFQWNFQRLDLERAWNINTGGSNAVVVAVIDSGVAYVNQGAFAQAPDLAGTHFVAGYDFIWNDDAPFDLDGHGTHVTGTIAQTTNNSTGTAGFAFNVSVMPIKALSTEWDEILGAPNLGTSVTVAQAIRFAVDHGAKVINLSLGGDEISTAERDAVVYAVDKGVVVVAAAGNEAESGSPPSFPAQYAKDLEGVIAVGAVDYQFQRAKYSNVNDYVEIAAPGGDVDADLNDDGYGDGVLQQTLDFDAVAQFRFNEFGYFFLNGTSMASPHVAAMAALLIDQGVTDPKAVEAALKKFATDLGPSGRDNETGYGLINPRATLRGLGLAR